ncbi:hypothetical protein BDK51DRAFT_52767 [Blyttiomyces helicus]|uniref:Uncharacterized protein n=1 Tax=Blyttiomyces helicus TaxID=388810 RepID=A0A4P9WIC7_9FUNG|nr:hypothetical protein BDK51DRAFT_52767 [Blyttiomyces helicus]|eukprot:RKO91633.1 hypothetical protein BDK51DRAFT_52767 [Blyttiomyces helicus]
MLLRGVVNCTHPVVKAHPPSPTDLSAQPTPPTSLQEQKPKNQVQTWTSYVGSVGAKNGRPLHARKGSEKFGALSDDGIVDALDSCFHREPETYCRRRRKRPCSSSQLADFPPLVLDTSSAVLGWLVSHGNLCTANFSLNTAVHARRCYQNDPTLRRPHHDPDHNLVRARAAYTGWLTLRSEMKPTAGSTPQRGVRDAVVTGTSPRAAGGGGRWSKLPFELLRPIFRRVRTARDEFASLDGRDRGERAGGYGEKAARRAGEKADGGDKEIDGSDGEESEESDEDEWDGSDEEEFDGSDGDESIEFDDPETWSETAESDLNACSLVCRAWEPAGSEQLLLVASARDRKGAGERHPVTRVRFARKVARSQLPIPETRRAAWAHVAREFLDNCGDFHRRRPPAAVTSPLLTTLDMSMDRTCNIGRLLLCEDIPEIASAITRLEYLSIPQLTLTDNPYVMEPAPAPAMGLALWFWAPNICCFADEMAESSLQRLECIEFPISPLNRPNVFKAFINKLASLRPPLRRVILAGSQLESECEPITDVTLAVLETNPPLRRLDLTDQSQITSPALVSLLRTRGSQLRLLHVNWPIPADTTVLKAVAHYAPNIEHIAIFGSYLDDKTINHSYTWESIQFLKDLAQACPRLKSFIWEATDVELTPDWDRIKAFLDGLGLEYRKNRMDYRFFNDSLTDPARSLGVKL